MNCDASVKFQLLRQKFVPKLGTQLVVTTKTFGNKIKKIYEKASFDWIWNVVIRALSVDNKEFYPDANEQIY